MKEAAGEANMTVITIVLIAIVLGVGTIIVRSVMNSTKTSSNCTSVGGVMYNGKCCYLPEYDTGGAIKGCKSYTKGVDTTATPATP